MTDKKNKPSLDEQTFDKLLEAAYVLQEHNREMRQMEESLELHSEQLRQQEAEAQAVLKRTLQPPEETSPANTDYTLTLAEIVEAQHQIQIRHLESDKAMAVVVERITRITNASGAAIAILDGKIIRYRAGAGAPALPLGTEFPFEKAVCTMCVRTGQVLRTPDVDIEFLFDPDLCRPRGILSLVAVPVYHDGNIVGALELYFDKVHGFAEQDIHTCQLMAGLVTEAIGRATESDLKKSMAAERSSMLAAIEKLKPSLAAMAEDSDIRGIVSKNVAAPPETEAESIPCWKCGGKLVEEEQFCGKCGAPRAGESDHVSMQSKFASAWHMQQASQEAAGVPTNGTGSVSEDETVPASISLQAVRNDNGGETPAITLAKSTPVEMPWTSASKAREFLEALAETGNPSALARFWRARRGDFYLVIAIVLVAIVIRWGILSDHSVGATGGGTGVAANPSRRRPDPNANLSTFDKLLIGLGLAEAPEVPEYRGNPDTQVWIDTHTALYYCPGSELYGKTPKGRFASQRDAQLDQFESASRKACD